MKHQNITSLISSKADYLLVSYLITYVIGLLYFIGLDHPFWTDEGHFFRTVELFYHSPGVDTLKSYNEMSTPLPFMLYAIWAKIGSLNIAWLRALSIIIALCTYGTIYSTFKAAIGNTKALAATIFLSLNPYMPGISIFVYTDMLFLLFTTLSLYAYLNNKNILFIISLSLALWCRQYGIFLIVGYGLVELYLLTEKKLTITPSLIIKHSLPTINLLPLLYLWGGLQPENELKNLYIPYAFMYHIDYTIAYMCNISIYLLPILLLYFYALRYQIKITNYLIALSVGLVYFLFPIKPSECAIEAGFAHIGIIDKILHLYLSNGLVINLIYYLTLALSILLLQLLAKKYTDPTYTLAICMCIGYFIALPFSYLLWEKYLIPLLPFITLAILKQENLFHMNKTITNGK